MPVRDTLYSLFGWYQPNPDNLTADEVKRSSGTIAGLENALSDSKSRITDGFKLSQDPVRQMADLADMADSSSVGPLLDVYAEEATQPDINNGKCLWYECNDTEVEKDLNAMLDRVNSEDYMLSLAFNLAGTGNDFRRILYNKEGVQQLISVPNREMRRLWDPTTKRLIGFRWLSQKPKEEDAPYKEDKSIFPPWDFLHFRRIYNTDTEYGVAILSKLFGTWRRLEMSLDQMVLYRIHTMPNRLALFVDIGDQDINDAMETLHTYSTLIRQKFSLNSSTGASESRYDPPALDSMLYVPVRSEEDKTKIESLAGDKDVPDIPDIEKLYKSLYGGARIPGAYVGHGDDSGNGLAQSSLVSQDMRFARLVRVIRRPIAAGFYRLGQLHLAYKGKDPNNYQIKVKMSRISSLEDEVNSSILEKQVSLAHSVAQLCKDLEIPNREIIDLVFREYLSVPRYFIDVAKLGSSLQSIFGGGSEDGGMGMGGMGMGGVGGDMSDLDFDEDGGGVEGDPSEQDGEGSSGKLQDSKIKVVKPSKKQKLRLKNGIEMLRRGSVNLTESKEKVIIESFIFNVKSLVSDLMSLQVIKKSSLVEGYTGDRLITEPIHTKAAELVESLKGTDVSNAIAMTEVVDGSGQKAEVHESVRMVKRARG